MMQKTVFAFNGSPRKSWNTATLLASALEGARVEGARTELIHLSDLHFTGCISCFSCKIRGGKSYGTCAVQDDLAPIFSKIKDADAIILGSPIYFCTVSGMMKAFMERLLFPYLPYTDPPQSLFPKRINTAFIYTMNSTEERMKQFCSQHIGNNERFLKLIFGATESLFSHDTYQFEDYSKVVAERFDPEEKARRRRDVFPEDCRRAYAMGTRCTLTQPEKSLG